MSMSTLHLSHALSIVLVVMAAGRFAIGLAPFVAPTLVSRRLGFPSGHDTPTARLMARWFGVRDVGLGVIVLWALGHPEAAGFVFLLNAAMDGGDLVSVAIPLVRRQGIDRAAISSSLFAASGGLAWLVVYGIAR